MRSATQSVWYQSRGIGLMRVSGAPVSPPGSAASSGENPWVDVEAVRVDEPLPVVLERPLAERGHVHRELGVLEAAVRTGRARAPT